MMPTINWNTSLYNDKHDFVAKYGEDVLSWLDPQEGEHILDVGCGTGTLTESIRQSGAIVTGIDSSEDMISAAKDSYPEIHFSVEDITSFSTELPFDAAFSNAVLHWIPEQQSALQCVYNSLKTGGRFVFEMGGKHNIENIHRSVKLAICEAGFEQSLPAESNFFPSVAEQCSLLESVGFTVTDVAYFKRPTVLKGEEGMGNWIRQFCTFFFTLIPSTAVDGIISQAVDIARSTNYSNGIWYGDYVRLRVKAVRENK